jgi:serine/threonine protein kinase
LISALAVREHREGMGDFPPQWTWVRDLDEGGQGHAYVVMRSDGSDSVEYALKRLKNPKRADYFEREIQACERLNHPNVLTIKEHGETPKGKPYLVTQFCAGGSLENQGQFRSPLEGLRFFLQVCEGVAHAHESGVFHLDIKPANIFLRNADAVVGDFGICYIEDGQYTMTKEGPRGSIYYCAPELRGPKLTLKSPLATADVYSLGKVLHWIFSHEVRDGHQEDYSQLPGNSLAELFPEFPEFAFVDELIEGTVQRDPYKRIEAGFSTAVSLRERVRAVIERTEAGGRVLDLTKPIRCLFCAAGTYKPLANLPPVELRLASPDPRVSPPPDIYEQMRSAAEAKGFRASPGGVGSIGPIVMACQHCGNVQEFRFDLAPEAIKNWKP